MVEMKTEVSTVSIFLSDGTPCVLYMIDVLIANLVKSAVSIRLSHFGPMM